jgi:hypothetical protein
VAYMRSVYTAVLALFYHPQNVIFADTHVSRFA